MLTASIISRRTRHLLIQKNASLYRQFSSGNDAVKGSGLRRIRSNTTPTSQKRSATQQHQKQTAVSSSDPGKYTNADPHAIANEMVFSATTIEGRTSGTEAIASITKEQKLSNYAMASGLLAFVSYIFYYSLSSVGGEENAKQFFLGDGGGEGKDGEAKVNPGFEEFLKEANEGRSEEERKLEDERVARGEARELAELEHTTAARLKAEGVEDEIVASANEDEEREMARAAGFEDSGKEAKKRPLWKKVVFFWRRE